MECDENMSQLLCDGFEYSEFPWGEIIHGSKEQLQAIGIGVGRPFPGEAGGNKRRMSVKDPRGYLCSVAMDSGVGRYAARIEFPDRESCPDFFTGDWVECAPGVVRRPSYWVDQFEGSEADLVVAGLVPKGCFPGFPGMYKTRVTVLPDGSLPSGRSNSLNCRAVGTRAVERVGQDRYRVEVTIPKEDARRRSDELWCEQQAWRRRMELLPRPPRIDGPIKLASNHAAADRRAGIHLVWSKPPFVPAFTLPPAGPFARG